MVDQSGFILFFITHEFIILFSVCSIRGFPYSKPKKILNMSADALDDDFQFDETLAKRAFSDIDGEGEFSETELETAGSPLNESRGLEASDDDGKAVVEAPAKKVHINHQLKTTQKLIMMTVLEKKEETVNKVSEPIGCLHGPL